jgi:ABC-2 type transport system permease protein
MTIWKLFTAALKMFVRNRQNFVFSLFVPLVIMTIFGFIGFDKVPVTKVGLVSDNPTTATQQFIDNLKTVPNFNVTVESEATARADMNKNNLAAIFLVPGDLISGAKTTKTVTILQNVGQAQSAGTAAIILNQALDKTALAMTGGTKIFAVKTEDVHVKATRYIDFLLPGIVGMSLMQLAVFGVAFVFADYKEKGILKRLLATPMKPLQFVSAQVAMRLLVSLAQAGILIALGILMYKTQVYGDWGLVTLIAVLGSIMFLGLGFTISGVASNVDAVPAIANVVVFPMMFLGGTFFPIDSMPVWLQHIVHYLPLQFLTHSLREVMANGASFWAVRYDLIWMLAWSVVMVALAMLTFRFEERRV